MLALIAIVAFVLITGATTGGSQASALAAFDNQPAPQSVLSQLRIPSSVADSVGIGLATNFPKSVTAKPLTLNGKPEIVYIGAEYCPYCALERWGLVIALMRFGNFTGLQYMTSSATDVGASTPTFTFVNATYTSKYIAFVSREQTNNKVNSTTGQYQPLQQLNASQRALVSKYDSTGSIPFMVFANETVQVGANYNDPTVIASMNWTTIADTLHNSPSSLQSLALVGEANLITAQICLILNNTPASTCSQSYVTSVERLLGH